MCGNSTDRVALDTTAVDESFKSETTDRKEKNQLWANLSRRRILAQSKEKSLVSWLIVSKRLDLRVIGWGGKGKGGVP